MNTNRFLKTSTAILCVIFFSFTLPSLKAQELDANWEETKLMVATISASTRFLGFTRSIVLFENSDPRTDKSLGLNLIEGSANSTIEEGGAIHITEDLNADVYLSAHSELVIGGSVSSSSSIYVSGLSAIYVNGSFEGEIHSTEPFHLHVNGDYHGKVRFTGSSNKIVVYGDFFGEVEPSGNSELYSAIVVVEGFTEQAVIESVYSHEYVTLTGVFYSSNVTPGIYESGFPGRKYYTVLEQRN